MRASGVHALGQLCAEEGAAHRYVPPLCTQERASLTALGAPWFHRLRAFFRSQCLSDGKGSRADQLAAVLSCRLSPIQPALPVPSSLIGSALRAAAGISRASGAPMPAQCAANCWWPWALAAAFSCWAGSSVAG